LDERYPQLLEDHKMLSYLHKQMEAAWERGEAQIQMTFSEAEYFAPVVGLFVLDEEQTDIGKAIGVRGAKAISMLKRLDGAGYVISDIEHHEVGGTFSFRGLNNPGLAAIGELPDGRERLIMSLEAALQSVQNDPTLTEAEKNARWIGWRRGSLSYGPLELK
jgi:hypothetical protein